MDVGNAAAVTVAKDGSGDYNVDGVNDEVEINQAISYISSISTPSNIGTVHIKAGLYKTKNQIDLKDNVILEGEGIGITILQLQPGTPTIADTGHIWIEGSNTVVQNMTVDNNLYNLGIPGGATYWNGIRIDGGAHPDPNNVAVQKTKIIQAQNDGIVGGGTNIFLRNIDIQDVHHSGVYFLTGTGYYIYNVTVNHTGNAGLRFYNSKNVYVQNYTVIDTLDYGFEIFQNGNGQYSDNITVVNFINKNPNSPEHSIILQSYQTTDQAWHITNITFKNAILDNNGKSRGYSSYGNPASGVVLHNANWVTLDNVVNYDSQGDGIYAINDLQGSKQAQITVKNSAIVKTTGYGINGGGYNINWNIIYTDIYNTSLGALAGGATAGVGVIYVDSLFANSTSGNPNNNDFHLKSQSGRWTSTGWVTDSATSPLIDAGDPSSDYSKEPIPNGNRINMGAYGNTKEASKNGFIFISGTVKDDFTNSGIAGAVITTNSSVAVIANGSGFYSLQVPLGTYILTATREPEYYPNSSVMITAISEINMTEDIELTKKPMGTISGFVTNSSTGEGISGAVVKLIQYPQYIAWTDSTGHYAIVNVPFGTYLISASGPI